MTQSKSELPDDADRDLRDAVAEVDRSLIQLSLSRTVQERLQIASKYAATLWALRKAKLESTSGNR